MDGREAVLPAREAAFSADMFEQDELAAGLQHALHLGERRLRAFDGAEDEGDDRGVERVVGEGQ